MKQAPWWHEPTRGQWISFSAAWLGWVLDAFDFTIFMLVMPHIAREFGVENLATTSSIALTLLARLAGGLIAGAAADRFGRKLPLMISIVWFALCDGAVAFAPSFTAILVLRTLFGLGMGAEWTSGTTLAMENWPARSRGIASGVLQGSWAVGYLAAALISSAVLPVWGWRGMFVLAALPALLVLPMRWWIPESPDWKRSAGKKSPSPLTQLLEPTTLRALLWSAAAMALGLGAYYALTGLYPTMLKTELLLDDHQVATLVAIFNLGMLGGSIFWGATAARAGAGVAIAIPALGSLIALPLYLGGTPALLPLGAFLIGALGVGFCGVVPLLLTGMVDAEVRARFVGLAYHLGALLAAFVPMLIALLAHTFGWSLALSIGLVAAGCELLLTIAVLAGPLTKSTRRVAPALAGLAVLAVLSIAGCGSEPEPEVSSSVLGLLESVAGFGANPGQLAMYRYVPAGVPPNAPVVVALHGCTQTAEAFSANGLHTLADQQKFYVVYPQQPSSNNPVNCFDWFGQYNNPANKGNITRGQGESESIKEMVDRTAADYSIDPNRVYVIGFSAGAAMAAVILADWPDVFKAGAIVAGVPFNCPATQNGDVFTCMNPGKVLAASDWGQRVQAAFPGFSGPYPRVSIWQGNQDFTVGTGNHAELIKQWTDVHGLSATPTGSDMVGGFPRDLFADSSGTVQVESYTITGMGHGFPVDPSHGCGTAGAYLLDEHLCAADRIIGFFGIGTSVSPADAGSTVPHADASLSSHADAAVSGNPDAAVTMGPADAEAASSEDGSTTNPPDAGAMANNADAMSSGNHPYDAGRLVGRPGDPSDAATPDGAHTAGSGGDFAGCSVAGHRTQPDALPTSLSIAAFVLLLGRRKRRTLISCAPMVLLSGCLTAVPTSDPHDCGVSVAPSQADNADSMNYRALDSHPGCSTDGLSYPAAQIDGYRCAAKAYPIDGAEDLSQPIVLLIHGNSSTPADWERFPADSPTAMLSDRLISAGVRTFAIDMRMDLTDDPTTNDPRTGNPAHNMDHAWGVPLIEHLIESVMAAYPDREISLVGFSFGPTAIRDALRRLHRRGLKPFERIRSLVFASGANHGVSSYRRVCVDPNTPANITMAGRVACQMGDRTAYVPTPFLAPLNGTDGGWETPCVDGDSAFGQPGACGGHRVRYTTVVMRDPPGSALQDEFVSEASSRLEGADNLTIDLSDQDQTLYFYNGHFKNHFGSIRSEAGLTLIMNALTQ